MKKTRGPDKQVGEKFMLNCGVEVELVEKIPSTLRVVVQDSSGRKKEVYTGALGTGEISWEWNDDGSPAEMKCGRNFKVGQVFTLNCGVDVTVTCTDPLTVVDYEQNTKIVEGTPLKAGAISWREFGVPSSHKGVRQIKLWDYVELNCGITVQMVEYVSCDRVLVEDDCGNSKWTSTSQLNKRAVAWKEFGVRSPSNLDKWLYAGQRLKSKKHGWYSVYEIHGAYKVIIRWDDYEGLQAVNSTQISTNTVKPVVVHWNYLGVNTEKYYVYLAIHKEEIVYVGKGKGNRYLHVTNGSSHNYYLNKLHFEGECVKVVIYKEYNSNEEAVLDEKRLILEYYPAYNTADKPKEKVDESLNCETV